MRSLLALKRWINKTWRKVTPEQCKKLMRSMPKRFKDVIKSGGRRLLSRRGQSKRWYVLWSHSERFGVLRAVVENWMFMCIQQTHTELSKKLRCWKQRGKKWQKLRVAEIRLLVIFSLLFSIWRLEADHVQGCLGTSKCMVRSKSKIHWKSLYFFDIAPWRKY